MANKYLDTAFVDKAIKFAVDAHANTERRGKGFPYVIHVLEAMEIVASMTNDPELLAAAALHDTVEDTDVTLEDLRREFGDRVAAIVCNESDVMTEGKSEEESWRSRKQAAIDRLAKAPRDSKIVALGDKLSNMRAIARDYHRVGDKLWSIFHAPGGKPDHEWHYRGLAESLSDLAGTEAYSEFTTHIKYVFGRLKPDLIDINDYELSGDGYTALSYNSLKSQRMIKLYADFMPVTEPEKEIAVSWALTDMGLNIPKAHRLVTDGKRIGVEFDRISPKKSIARAISEEPENLEKYALQFAGMCKKLHSTICDTEVFGSASAYFKKVVNNSNLFKEAEKEKMIAFINSVPEQSYCCHGDMHIGNVIFNTETKEYYWIDLSDFRYGNPLFDLGMFYLACNCNPDDLTMKLYHVGNATMQKVWKIFAREYFGPDADIQAEEDKIKPFAALYMVYYGGRDVLYPNMRAFIEENLL